MGAGEVRNTMLTSVSGGERRRRRRRQSEPSLHKLGHGPATPPSDGDGRDRSGTTAAGPQMPEEEKARFADLGGDAQGSGRRRRPFQPGEGVPEAVVEAAGAVPGDEGAGVELPGLLGPSKPGAAAGDRRCGGGQQGRRQRRAGVAGAPGRVAGVISTDGSAGKKPQA
ncbi:spidroin-2-like [Ananas comosus]|uniref:Spidroin-2-like n=1 Tax=Ananas comosus TaxID=4615 RepID=A0A6P5EUS4_ANACO|nr:spidroin-2-like [Ananas comosus]